MKRKKQIPRLGRRRKSGSGLARDDSLRSPRLFETGMLALTGLTWIAIIIRPTT